MVGADWAISSRPTAVEPVKDSLRTVSLPVISAPIGPGEPVTTLNTTLRHPGPLGEHRERERRERRQVGGLDHDRQPAAKAGATLRVIIAIGKFHGVIAAQTPTGSLSTSTRRSPTGAVNTSPVMRRASSANHFTKLARRRPRRGLPPAACPARRS